MPRRATYPSYTRDIVEGIKRWDERDVLFSRRDLFRFFGPDTPEYRSYYEEHPEFLEYDKAIHNMGELGRTGGADGPMFEAQFLSARALAGESFVDGAPAAPRKAVPPERAGASTGRA